MATMIAIPDARGAGRPRAVFAEWQAWAAVLAGSALLRLVGLGHAPLWLDEVATAGFAGLSWQELFLGVGRLEPNPPAFYALEKLWTGVAGGSDLALRLPVAAAGVAGVVAVALLARSAFGRQAGVWTAVLMAAQSQHLEHAREARAYAPLFLAVALAALAGRRLAREGGAWPTAGLALAAGTAMLLHDTGAIAVACVFLYAGVVAMGRPRALLALAAAGAGALAVGAPALLAAVRLAGDKASNAAWIPVPDVATAVQTALAVLAVPLGAWQAVAPALLLTAAAFGLVIVATVVAWAAGRAGRSADAAGMLAATAAAVLLLYGISQAVPVLLDRTLMFALVFFVPLAGATLAAVPMPTRAALAALMLAAQAPGMAEAFAPTRHTEDWRGLATELQREAVRTGWPVVVLGGFEAMALDRVLPAGPGRATVSLTPRMGGALLARVTPLLTAARALPPDSTAQAVCAALGPAGGVLLVTRESVLMKATRPGIEDLLTAAGGTPAPPVRFGRLGMQAWRGACG